MVHLLAWQQDIPHRFIVQLHIYAAGFKAMCISKKTRFVIDIAYIQDGIETVSQVTGSEVYVRFAPCRIAETLALTRPRILIDVYRIRRGAAAAVTQVCHP